MTEQQGSYMGASVLQPSLSPVTAYIALLGQDGTILEVNQAWPRFVRQLAARTVHDQATQARPASAAAEASAGYVGVNYFDLCSKLCGDDPTVARAVVEGCRDVLADRLDEFSLEYAMESQEATRWFIVRAVRLPGQGKASLLVSHEDVTTLRGALETVTREGRKRTALSELGAALRETARLEETLERVAYALHALMKFDWLAIAVLDGPDRFTVTEYEGSAGTTVVTRSAGHAAPDSLWGAAVRRSAAVRGSAVSPEALALDFLDSGRLIARARLRSFAAAPMVLGGQVSGAIAAASRTASAYSQADLDALEMIAALVAGAVANAGRAAAELDLSEHRDLVLRLEADTRDLQAAREERTHFISNVSHEFKAPLTAVVAFADILARNRERTLTEKQLEHIRTIQRNASRLNLMVTDLLDMTRIDSGTFSLRKSRTDACAIADEVVQGIRPTLARKKQRLVLIKGRDHVPVLADHDRLAQILTNLLDNASKYSEERKELRLSVHVNGEWLHLSVEDQGVGIPPSALADVFRPFFRVDNESTRSVPGTGLGLAIVKRIAEMHGGSVDIKSIPGRGTTVHAALPVVIRE